MNVAPSEQLSKEAERLIGARPAMELSAASEAGNLHLIELLLVKK